MNKIEKLTSKSAFRLLAVKTIFFTVFTSAFIFGQDSTQASNEYKIEIENNVLKVSDDLGNPTYSRSFYNPFGQAVDLDGDGAEEYVVINSDSSKGRELYTIYIYSAVDSFYIADSITSGFTEPLVVYSEELKGTMIITGNDKFDKFVSDSEEVFLPLKCWKYDSGNIFLINDELYDIFISTNDSLIGFLDSCFENATNDCSTSEKMKAVIAEVYANYISAGEKTLAVKFLRKYYQCGDLENFEKDIQSLF